MSLALLRDVLLPDARKNGKLHCISDLLFVSKLLREIPRLCGAIMKLKEAIFQASLKYHYGQVIRDLEKMGSKKQPGISAYYSKKRWEEKPKIDTS